MRGCPGLVKLILSGSLPVMNSEKYTPRLAPVPAGEGEGKRHSTRLPQQQQQQQQQPHPQHRLLPRGNSGKQAAVTAEQQGNSPSHQAKAERAERRGSRQSTKG